MLEALPDHIQKILLSYDFIKKYLEGNLSKNEFLEYMKQYSNEIISRGVDEQHIKNLIKADDEQDFNRKASYNRFVKFARRLGLDIATREDKVAFLKNSNAEQFLDILSISSGLLRGAFSFQRWRDRHEEKIIVSGFGTDLEPPDKSYIEFTKFFELMKKDITPNNIEMWAVKLYIAIIFAHIFPNGNGRLARNAYFLLKSEGLLDEKQSSTRTKLLLDTCKRVNLAVIHELVKAEGIKSNFNEIGANELYDEKDEDEFICDGDTEKLKYIAIRRVLIRNKAWNNKNHVGLKNLSDNITVEYINEYQKVRQEWFWKGIALAGDEYKWIGNRLDEAIKA